MIPAFPIWSRRIRKEQVKVFFLSGFWPPLVITHIHPHEPSTGLLGRGDARLGRMDWCL